jgi:hypothetical protein
MDTDRADRWIRTGAVLFLIGLVATAFDVIPFFYGEHNRPVWLNSIAASGLTIGLGLALAGIVIMVRTPVPGAEDLEFGPVDAGGTAPSERPPDRDAHATGARAEGASSPAAQDGGLPAPA